MKIEDFGPADGLDPGGTEVAVERPHERDALEDGVARTRIASDLAQPGRRSLGQEDPLGRAILRDRRSD
ncbi:hypothetical protein ACX0FC_19235, partial [Enterococcus faecium]